MIVIKTPREQELMRKAGRVVALVFKGIEDRIVPGLTTLDVANMCEKIIRENGAYPTFLGYGGFSGSVCVSINDEIVHGIPSKHRVIHEGDIVSVDVGATLNGYIGDACRTFIVGTAPQNAIRLVKVTEESFFEGLKHARPGAHLGDISHAIQVYAESHGYSIIEEYTGHGVGSALHEDPYIPNYGVAGTGPILKEGMTLAIEPMVAEGKKAIRVNKDGWTARTKDGKLSSHYENSILITKDGYEILTMLKEEN